MYEDGDDQLVSGDSNGFVGLNMGMEPPEPGYGSENTSGRRQGEERLGNPAQDDQARIAGLDSQSEAGFEAHSDWSSHIPDTSS
jgi:hypothetical protein